MYMCVVYCIAKCIDCLQVLRGEGLTVDLYHQ
jgi:hypothetical protein